jgi:hypothetical protein
VENEMDGTCSLHGENGKWQQNVGLKSQRKMAHEEPRHRWDDNIKMNPRELGCEAGDWIE